MPRVCLGPCPIGGVWRFRGWRWHRDRGGLLRIAVDCAPVFPFLVIEPDCAPEANHLSKLIYSLIMTAAASEFPPSLQRVTGIQGPRDDQDNPQTATPVQQPEHVNPPPLDINMTPLDDSLAPVPRDLTVFNITIPKYPNSASCFTCGDRISARGARARKGAKHARVLHLRCCGLTPDELAGVSGLQDVSDVQRDGFATFSRRRRSKPVILPHRTRLRPTWPKSRDSGIRTLDV